jgi:hypothetical protein
VHELAGRIPGHARRITEHRKRLADTAKRAQLRKEQRARGGGEQQ